MDPSLPTGLPPVRPSPGESFFRLGRLVRKELIEIIRDRRTIITLVLMPLLLYPLLSVAFQQFFLASSIDPNRGQVYRFGFATQREYQVFFGFLEFGQQLLDRRAAPKQTKDGPAPAGPRLDASIFADLEKALRTGEVDLAVRLPDSEQFEL